MKKTGSRENRTDRGGIKTGSRENRTDRGGI
jgi:hypothetical protein